MLKNVPVLLATPVFKWQMVIVYVDSHNCAWMIWSWYTDCDWSPVTLGSLQRASDWAEFVKVAVVARCGYYFMSPLKGYWLSRWRS